VACTASSFSHPPALLSDASAGPQQQQQQHVASQLSAPSHLWRAFALGDGPSFGPGSVADAQAMLQWGTVFCLTCLLWFVVPRIINRIAKSLIETVDRVVLSVDVHMESIEISFLHRTLVMKKLCIDNPAGFTTDYLLKVDYIEMKVSIFSILCSRGHSIDLPRLSISNMDIMCEYQSLSTNTNLQVVQDFLKGVSASGPSGGGGGGPPGPARRPRRRKKVEFVLHEVLIEKIVVHLRMPRPELSILAGSQVDLPFQAACIQDIYFEDFQEEKGVMMFSDLVRFFVSNVLKQAMLSTEGVTSQVQRACQEALSVARGAAGTTMRSMEASVGQLQAEARRNLHAFGDKLAHTITASPSIAKDKHGEDGGFRDDDPDDRKIQDVFKTVPQRQQKTDRPPASSLPRSSGLCGWALSGCCEVYKAPSDHGSQG